MLSHHYGLPHLDNNFAHRPGSSGLIPLGDVASTWVSSCIHRGFRLGSSWKQTTYTDGSFHKLHSYACLTATTVYDIDVLIETKNLNMVALRSQLQELGKHFAAAGIKLYFVKVRSLPLKLRHQFQIQITRNFRATYAAMSLFVQATTMFS